jgi:hypothetical protein
LVIVLTLKAMGFMKHNFPLNPLEGNYVFDVVDQAISICHQDLTFYQQDIMPFHPCHPHVFLTNSFMEKKQCTIFMWLKPMDESIIKIQNIPLATTLSRSLLSKMPLS